MGTVWPAGLFIVAIFIGDVWLVKLTLPMSMLLIPLLFVIARPYEVRVFPVGIFLLLGLLAIAGLQVASGMSLNAKADTAMWRPTLYAVATLFCLGTVVLPDEKLKSAIFIGGIVTGVIMLAMIAFAPPDLFLIPGQNVSETADKFYAQAPPVGARHANAYVTAQFSPAISAGSEAFYGLKNQARNLLGGSNYIAVFLVLVFTVAIFTRSRLVAILIAALVLMTASRFGALCLVASTCSYFIYKRGVTASRICALIFAAGIVGLILFCLLGPHLPQITASATARLSFVQSALDIVADHAVIGAPRSLVLDDHNFNIVWSPHSSILQLAVYFGAAGLALYAAYVWVVFRSLGQLSKSSDLWAGISVGLSLTFAWSLLEIIVITPAFEILFATTYALAHCRRSTGSDKLATTNPPGRMAGTR